MRIVIAGGGTGGHLFPGIAIAEEFMRRNAGHDILFVGTGRGLEGKILPTLGWPLRLIDAEGIKGRSLPHSFRAAGRIPRAMWQSYRILRDFRPHMTIGVGGYASGPVLMTAWLMGCPTAVAEQNAIPGATNRILGRFVNRIFLSFPDHERRFPPGKTSVTGNPVRASFLAVPGARRTDSVLTVLVLGGSQGSRAINRAVIDSLPHLAACRNRIRWIHQTGAQDLPAVTEAYRSQDVRGEATPFITEMAATVRAADVLVCRAGATTIAEITACGKASVLIPFPYAIDDHQTRNAEILVRGGAAILIPEKELDGRRLAETIVQLAGSPDAIRSMEENARRLGHPRAASDIVDACLALAA